LTKLTSTAQHTLLGRKFFPQLISGPFHQGLVVVFAFSTALIAIAGVMSVLRGPRLTPIVSGDVPVWSDGLE
jgi:hypothetical protein